MMNAKTLSASHENDGVEGAWSPNSRGAVWLPDLLCLFDHLLNSTSKT